MKQENDLHEENRCSNKVMDFAQQENISRIIIGDITNIEVAFNQTRDEYFNISLVQGSIFDAGLNSCFYSHKEEIYGVTTLFYAVDITLSLNNGISQISKDVIYTIACNPDTT